MATTQTNQRPGKVTFEAFDNISYDDNATQCILLDGVQIGEIVKCVEDVGGAIRCIRVVSYDVSFFALPNATDDEMAATDREFRVSRRRSLGVRHGFDTARAAHKAAKDYVRETVSVFLSEGAA